MDKRKLSTWIAFLGELCLVSDNNKDWIVRYFSHYNKGIYCPYVMTDEFGYEYMKRIKVLD